MTIMGGQFTTGFKNASKETGIPGTEEEADIFGSAMAIIAPGITNMKKEHGGILPGITLPDRVDPLLINFILISHPGEWKKAIIILFWLFSFPQQKLTLHFLNKTRTVFSPSQSPPKYRLLLLSLSSFLHL